MCEEKCILIINEIKFATTSFRHGDGTERIKLDFGPSGHIFVGVHKDRNINLKTSNCHYLKQDRLAFRNIDPSKLLEIMESCTTATKI